MRTTLRFVAALFVGGALTACGEVRSPDFVPQLKAVQVDPATATVFDALGQTQQYRLQALYSTPPGSASAFTVREVTASGWESADVNTLGIDGEGRGTAVRNGVTSIRGRFRNLVSPPHALTVAAPVLQSITFDPATAAIPLGLAQPVTALGSYRKRDGSTEQRPVSEALAWTSSDPTVARVPASGTTVALQSLRQSAAAITLRTQATAADGSLVQGSGSYTVIAPELVQVLVRRSSNQAAPPFRVPRGGVLNLKALGVFTDSSLPRDLPRAVTWTSADAAATTLALLRQPNGSLDVTGLNLGSSSVTATTTRNDGSTAISSAPAAVEVGAAILESLNGARIVPSPATVAVGASRQLAVIGRFSDGSEAALPQQDLLWTVADTALAGIGTTGVATGKQQGDTVVSAALRVPPVLGAGSVSAPLAVTDAVCTAPLLASQGALVETTTTPVLCLACTAADAPLAIDNDVATAARLDVSLGLVGGSAELTARASTPLSAPVAGQRAGFIVSRPTGELLSLALLGGVTLATVDAGGVEQETSTSSDGLRLTLLGNYVLGQDAYLLSMPVSTPFSGVRVRLGAGVATAAESLLVNSACAAVSE